MILQVLQQLRRVQPGQAGFGKTAFRRQAQIAGIAHKGGRTDPFQRQRQQSCRPTLTELQQLGQVLGLAFRSDSTRFRHQDIRLIALGRGHSDDILSLSVMPIDF